MSDNDEYQYVVGHTCAEMVKPVTFAGKRTDFGPIDYEILAKRKDDRFKYGYKGVLRNLSNSLSYYGNYRYRGHRYYTASFRTIEEAAWAFYVTISELPDYNELPARQLRESAGGDEYASRKLIYAVNRMAKAIYKEQEAMRKS